GCRLLLFFFSSRRRHTRSKRDWSSDVCSSDLVPPVVQLSVEWVPHPLPSSTVTRRSPTSRWPGYAVLAVQPWALPARPSTTASRPAAAPQAHAVSVPAASGRHAPTVPDS